MNAIHNYLPSYPDLIQTIQTNWKGHKIEILSGGALSLAGFVLSSSALGFVALSTTVIGLCLLGHGLFQPPHESKEPPKSEFRELHLNALRGQPKGYPERYLVLVLQKEISWSVDHPSYNPPEYTSTEVLENAKLLEGDKKRWADPEFAELKGREFFSYRGITHYDKQGRPLNPIGRTGLAGRGLLGKWGANQAGDPVVTRINPETQNLEILVIQRKDNGQWAIPGGMQDTGELISATCKRELGEETNANIDFGSLPIIYQGYVDDPRNTDNAWMETSVIHVHLDAELAAKQQIQAGDDARKAQWQPITEDFVNTLYASHPHFVSLTLGRLDRTIVEASKNKAEILAIAPRLTVD